MTDVISVGMATHSKRSAIAVACLILVPLLVGCSPSVKVPSDVWHFLYNAEKYRDRAQGTVNDLDGMRDTVPDEYADAKMAYDEARGKWNGLIDNLETILIANAPITQWSRLPEAADEATTASENFFAASQRAVVAYRRRQVELASGNRPPAARGAGVTISPVSLPVPTWDQIVGVWKEVNRISSEQRQQVVAELEKRKWARFECVVHPLDPACFAPLPPRPLPSAPAKP